MPTARVLIVDDMALYRSAVKASVTQAGMTVVAVSRNGTEALAHIQEYTPDLVVLDLEMPDMTGIDVLRRLQENPPAQPPQIIVFSAHSEKGAAITIEALELGAADFAVKPSSSEGFSGIANSLIPKLEKLADAQNYKTETITKPTAVTTPQNTQPVQQNTQRRILAIASSTGGPQALRAALIPFPATFPVPIVIVQHMPPIFTKSLADNINDKAQLTVLEAEDGMTLQPGHAYIAPGDFHMIIESKDQSTYTIRLNQSEKINALRPAADNLFHSLAPLFGAKTLAAVFTGMGNDGTAGTQSLINAGAECLTQTAESCSVYGMPRAVDEAELASSHFTPETFYHMIRQYNFRW